MIDGAGVEKYIGRNQKVITLLEQKYTQTDTHPKNVGQHTYQKLYNPCMFDYTK